MTTSTSRPGPAERQGPADSHGWELVSGPATIVRNEGLSVGTLTAGELLADVTAGLAQRFTDVLPIDLERSARGTHLVHAATDPRGEGIVVETRLDSGGTAHCWVSPVATYAASRRSARAAMGGLTVAPPPSTMDDGAVPVAEAWLERDGYVAAVRRRGPVGQFVPFGADGPLAVPVSVLPGLLFAATGLGPRPVPPSRPVTAIRRTELKSHTAARWVVDWAIGRDLEQQPADEEWSTAEMVDGGRLEVLDGGPEQQLLRVLAELPEPLATDARESMVDGDLVGLVPTTAADIFAVLALLAA